MNTELIIALIPGIAVILLLLGLYKSTTLEKKVQAQENIERLLHDKKPTRPGGVFASKDSDQILKRRKKKKGEESFLDNLETQLERANLIINPQEFILISLGSGVLTALAMMFVLGQNLIVSILLGAVGTLFPYVYLKLRTILRMKKAAGQFADVIDSMVNGFKTGYGFSRAVQMVADTYDDPWGTEFGKMAAEMNLGSSQEDALAGLSTRIPSPDVDLFVTAILIQRETGGNMSELLGNLSKTIRDRYKLFQRVGAISAQGKLSAGIVICVPFVLAGLMFLFLPDAMVKFVTNPIGIVLLVLAGFWMICGIGVLFKIVQIEV